ncbi:Hypothetical protein D9617_7g029470 [Elsinoe fawcettii]|nr:Hypothetical protein D9617_7g029470 [Elsinoe fawcettii]
MYDWDADKPVLTYLFASGEVEVDKTSILDHQLKHDDDYSRYILLRSGWRGLPKLSLVRHNIFDGTFYLELSSDDMRNNLGDCTLPGVVLGSPLIAAAWNGHLPVVKYLIACGTSLIQDVGLFGTALVAAAAAGELAVVRFLVLHRSFSGKSTGAFGSAVTAAVILPADGHRKETKLKILQLLLAVGERGDSATPLHGPALCEAVSCDNIEAYQLLREYRHAFTDESPCFAFGTPLLTATYKMSPGTVEFLVKSGENDLYARGTFRTTALALALRRLFLEHTKAKAERISIILLKGIWLDDTKRLVCSARLKAKKSVFDHDPRESDHEISITDNLAGKRRVVSRKQRKANATVPSWRALNCAIYLLSKDVVLGLSMIWKIARRAECIELADFCTTHGADTELRELWQEFRSVPSLTHSCSPEMS